VFVDDVAEIVERAHYPHQPPGKALPVGVALREGTKAAALTLLVYLIALPFVLFAGAGFIAFFVATAWLRRPVLSGRSRTWRKNTETAC